MFAHSSIEKTNTRTVPAIVAFTLIGKTDNTSFSLLRLFLSFWGNGLGLSDNKTTYFLTKYKISVKFKLTHFITDSINLKWIK